MKLAMTHTSLDFLQELGIRIIIFIVYMATDKIQGFHRKIQPEEMWLYRFPITESYYSANLLLVTIFVVPVIVASVFYILHRDKEDLKESIFGAYLSIFLTGLVTNFIKLCVGRPRPCFLQLCFPDGHVNLDMKCSGNPEQVIEGYKSFPSGHSSFAFSCLGYVGLYVAGKLKVFNRSGRGNGCRLCCVVIPFLWATLIALSRLADYHHHWEDVLVGSGLGMAFAYLCYHQGYPSVSSIHSHLTYFQLAKASSYRDVDAQSEELQTVKYGQFEQLQSV